MTVTEPLETSTEASIRASLAAHSRWAKVTDRAAATSAMRQGFIDKLYREARERLGPNATDKAVAQAAENALQAHYARMRLNSLKVRRAKKS